MKYTKEDIKNFYHKEGLSPTSTQSHVYSEAKPLSRARMDLVKAFLDKWSTDVEYFVEIGCAEGYYCEYMSTRVRDVVGLDISEPKLLRAVVRPNIQYVVGDWDNMTMFDTNSFDLALASECIEHSLDPAVVIKEVFRVAKSCIFSVPLNETLKQSPLEQGSGHLHSFTIDSFLELFKDYEVVDWQMHESMKFVVAIVTRNE